MSDQKVKVFTMNDKQVKVFSMNDQKVKVFSRNDQTPTRAVDKVFHVVEGGERILTGNLKILKSLSLLKNLDHFFLQTRTYCSWTWTLTRSRRTSSLNQEPLLTENWCTQRTPVNGWILIERWWWWCLWCRCRWEWWWWWWFRWASSASRTSTMGGSSSSTRWPSLKKVVGGKSIKGNLFGTWSVGTCWFFLVLFGTNLDAWKK